MPDPRVKNPTRESIIEDSSKYGYDLKKPSEQNLNPNELYRRNLRNKMYTAGTPEERQSAAKYLMNNMLGLPIDYSKAQGYGTNTYENYSPGHFVYQNRATPNIMNEYNLLSQQYPQAMGRVSQVYSMNPNERLAPDSPTDTRTKLGQYNMINNKIGVVPNLNAGDTRSIMSHELSHAMGTRDIDQDTGHAMGIHMPISSYNVGDASEIAYPGYGKDINLPYESKIAGPTGKTRQKLLLKR